MAIGDIPKFPLKYTSRGNALIQKLEKQELTVEDFKSTIATVLGRVSMGSEGIRVAGEFGAFEIGEEAFKAVIASLHELVDFLPAFDGKTFFLKRGEKITKVTIALPPKQTSATLTDFQNSELPMIELPPETTQKEKFKAEIERYARYFEGLVGARSEAQNRVKIHRIEELAGWLGDEWEGIVKLFDIVIPLLELTKKETLDKLGESYPSFWDQVFKRCGV